MNGLDKIHDECLEYEIEIEDDVAQLTEKRIEAYKSEDKEVFRQIIPVLNAIIQDAEAYKEYVREIFKEKGGESHD